MKCARAQELISSLLDEQLDETGSRALAQHLAACRACAEEMQLMGRVKRALQSVPARRCPDSVWTGVSRQIAASPQPRLLPRRCQVLAPAWVVAGAAMVCITLLRGPEPVSQDGTRILAPLAPGKVAMASLAPSAPAPDLSSVEPVSSDAVFSDAAFSDAAFSDAAFSGAVSDIAPGARDRSSNDRRSRGASSAHNSPRDIIQPAASPAPQRAASHLEETPHSASAWWTHLVIRRSGLPARLASVRTRQHRSQSTSPAPPPTLVALGGAAHDSDPAFAPASPPAIAAPSPRGSRENRTSTPSREIAGAVGTTLNPGTGTSSGNRALLDSTDASRIASLVRDEQSDTQALDQTGKDLVGMSMQAGGTGPGTSGA